MKLFSEGEAWNWAWVPKVPHVCNPYLLELLGLAVTLLWAFRRRCAQSTFCSFVAFLFSASSPELALQHAMCCKVEFLHAFPKPFFEINRSFFFLKAKELFFLLISSQFCNLQVKFVVSSCRETCFYSSSWSHLQSSLLRDWEGLQTLWPVHNRQRKGDVSPAEHKQAQCTDCCDPRAGCSYPGSSASITPQSSTWLQDFKELCKHWSNVWLNVL